MKPIIKHRGGVGILNDRGHEAVVVKMDRRGQSASHSNRYAMVGKILLGVLDAEFTEMEDRGGKDRVGATWGEGVNHMVELAGAARGDDRNVDPRADLGQQLDVVAVLGAVAVHAGHEQFARAEIRGAFRPFDRVKTAGLRPPWV